MESISDPEQIGSPAIRDLFVYWRDRCPEGSIPGRADFDPFDVPSVLPNLMMVDFEQEPFRVKFRLVGTKVVDITGFEFTGKYLDEIAMPDVARDFLDCYRTASHTMEPVYARLSWRFDEHTTGRYDFCVLPLEAEGGIATKAVAMECYERMERTFSERTDGRPTGVEGDLA